MLQYFSAKMLGGLNLNNLTHWTVCNKQKKLEFERFVGLPKSFYFRFHAIQIYFTYSRLT